MKMHILSGGKVKMRRAVYYPGAPREEMLDLPVSCTLLRHPQGNVLFDTGCSPEAAIDPVRRWGGLMKAMVPDFAPEDAVIHQLPKVGLTADDIDVVICSHLHADHCGCNEHFRRATVLAHADELADARAENGVAMGYFPHEWDVPQGFDAFSAQRDLFGDGRIVVLPMPGHTAGMSVVLASLDRTGEVLLASDAVPIAALLREPYAPKNSWDVAKAVAAVEEIAAMAARGVKVIFGHDVDQWAALRKGAEFYD